MRQLGIVLPFPLDRTIWEFPITEHFDDFIFREAQSSKILDPIRHLIMDLGSERLMRRRRRLFPQCEKPREWWRKRGLVLRAVEALPFTLHS